MNLTTISQQLSRLFSVHAPDPAPVPITYMSTNPNQSQFRPPQPTPEPPKPQPSGPENKLWNANLDFMGKTAVATLPLALLGVLTASGVDDSLLHAGIGTYITLAGTLNLGSLIHRDTTEQTRYNEASQSRYEFSLWTSFLTLLGGIGMTANAFQGDAFAPTPAASLLLAAPPMLAALITHFYDQRDYALRS